ncbi:MAG: SDR family oxidoreductase [Actinomycetota bacterium]|nr:SDR family oxidoreductase [Actinomycetota bacterium]
MELSDKTIIVTGAGSGIGAALCHRFHREGPQGIVVADLNETAAEKVAHDVGGMPYPLDVTDETAVLEMVAATRSEFGPIDLFCLNAGIATSGSVDVPTDAWQRTWEVNVMSHVYGVRAVLPEMLDRGTGYLLHTASAAGLLTNIGAAPYTVTKHAVVALAEWLSITYGSAGVTVSCLSPQFVRTDMLDQLTKVSSEFSDFAHEISITVDDLADKVVAGIAAGRFHILPHPEVASYMVSKARDPERWLDAMRSLQHSLGADPID